MEPHVNPRQDLYRRLSALSLNSMNTEALLSPCPNSGKTASRNQRGQFFSLWLAFHEQPALLFRWMGSPELMMKFLAGILVLGVVVSWFSTQVWNRVSRKLPITVAGQLLVVQSLAAIAYGSWLDRQVPHIVELTCVVLVVVGVVWGVKAAYEPDAKNLGCLCK